MVRLRRRQFLQGSLALAGVGMLAGCGILPLAQRAPRPKRIGVLFAGSADEPRFVEQRTALLDGLRELGRVEGEDVVLEYRFAQGSIQRLPDLAGELAHLPVELIVTAGDVGVSAALRSTE